MAPYDLAFVEDLIQKIQSATTVEQINLLAEGHYHHPRIARTASFARSELIYQAEVAAGYTGPDEDYPVTKDWYPCDVDED